MKNFSTEDFFIILKEVQKEVANRTFKNSTSIIKEWVDLKKSERTINYNLSSCYIEGEKFNTLTLTITNCSNKEVFIEYSYINTCNKELKALVSSKALNECSFFDKSYIFKYESNSHEICKVYITNEIRNRLFEIQKSYKKIKNFMK